MLAQLARGSAALLWTGRQVRAQLQREVPGSQVRVCSLVSLHPREPQESVPAADWAAEILRDCSVEQLQGLRAPHPSGSKIGVELGTIAEALPELRGSMAVRSAAESRLLAGSDLPASQVWLVYRWPEPPSCWGQSLREYPRRRVHQVAQAELRQWALPRWVAR